VDDEHVGEGRRQLEYRLSARSSEGGVNLGAIRGCYLNGGALDPTSRSDRRDQRQGAIWWGV